MPSVLRNTDQDSPRACGAGAKSIPAQKEKISHLMLEKCHWNSTGLSLFHLGMGGGG